MMMRGTKILCMLPLLILLPKVSLAADQNREIHSAVERLAVLLSDGSASLYPSSIEIRHGHVLSPSSQDAVVMFTLEGFGGGNGYSQYLAVYERNTAFPGDKPPVPPYRLVNFLMVGAKGWRLFDMGTIQMKTGAISLSGKSYSSKDALCCPSQPVHATFTVTGHGITDMTGVTRSNGN